MNKRQEARVHGFLFKTRAVIERSVRFRVFVSPSALSERGETWRKRKIDLLWRKTSCEVQGSCVPCSKQAPSGQGILPTRSVRGMELSRRNWLESLAGSLRSK